MFIAQRIRQLFLTSPLIALLVSMPVNSTPMPSPSPSSLPYVSTTGCDDLLPAIKEICQRFYKPHSHAGVLLLTPERDAAELIDGSLDGNDYSNYLILGYTGSDADDVFIEADYDIVLNDNQHLQGVSSPNGTLPKLRNNHPEGTYDLIHSNARHFRLSGFELDDTHSGEFTSLLYATDFESILVEANHFIETGGGHVALNLEESVCPTQKLNRCQAVSIVKGNIILTAQDMEHGPSDGMQLSSSCNSKEGSYMAAISNQYKLVNGTSGINFHSGALLVRDDMYLQTQDNGADSNSYGIRFDQQASEVFRDSIIDKANFRANGHSNVFGIRLQGNADPDNSYSVEISGNTFTGNKAAIIFSNANADGVVEGAATTDIIAENSVCNIWAPDSETSNTHPCLGAPKSGFVHFLNAENENIFCGTEPEDFNTDCSSPSADPCQTPLPTSTSIALTPSQTPGGIAHGNPASNSDSSSARTGGIYAAITAGTLILSAISVTVVVFIVRMIRGRSNPHHF